MPESEDRYEAVRVADGSYVRGERIPDDVWQWCKDNEHTDLRLEAGHWRAFPEGAVMSVPFPVDSSEESRPSNLTQMWEAARIFPSEPVWDTDSLRRMVAWENDRVSAMWQANSRVIGRHEDGSPVVFTEAQPLASRPFLSQMIAQHCLATLLKDPTDWETDPLGLMRIFPAQDLSARNIRRHVSRQIFRLGDWLDDLSIWIEPD